MTAFEVALISFGIVWLANAISNSQNWVGEAASGVRDATAVVAWVAVAFWIIGLVASVALTWFDSRLALSSLEDGIASAQSTSDALFGSNDWRLVLGLFLFAIGAAFLIRAPTAAASAISTARIVRRLGGVLSIAAAFSFLGGPTATKITSFEARLKDTRAKLTQQYGEVSDRIDQKLRLAEISALKTAVDEECAQHSQPPSDCDPMMRLDDARTSAGTSGSTDQDAFWRGSLSSTSGPPSPPSPPSAAAPPPDISLSQIEAADSGEQNSASHSDDPYGNDLLIGLAASSGFDSAIKLASTYGASGAVVAGLLNPLVSEPLQSLIGSALTAARDRIIRGQSVDDECNAFRTTVTGLLEQSDSQPIVWAAVGRASTLTQDAAGHARGMAESQTAEAGGGTDVPDASPTPGGLERPFTPPPDYGQEWRGPDFTPIRPFEPPPEVVHPFEPR